MYAVGYVRDFRINNKDCLLEIGDESLNSKMDPTLFFVFYDFVKYEKN